MGSQWKGMGRSLLQIPIFSQSIDKCTAALKFYDLNIRDLLLSSDEKVYENPINIFVALTAVQVRVPFNGPFISMTYT